MKLLSLNLQTVRAGDRALSWRKRYEGIAALLCEQSPDVLCLQEATPEAMALLRKALPEYRLLFHGCNSDRCGEGLVFAFRPETAQPLCVIRKWLSDMPDSAAAARCRAFGLRDMSAESGATFHGLGVGKPKKLDYIFADARLAALPYKTKTISTLRRGMYLSDHDALWLKLPNLT